MICLVAIDRIVPDLALGTIGIIASDTPLWRAARRTVPFSYRNKVAVSAWQICTTLSNITSKTTCNSPGELEMTWSTSELAVCCCSDSDSSWLRCCSASNSRTVSMAITTWSAKVATSSISRSVNGSTRLRARDANRLTLARQRHTDHRADP